ncbi:MAG: FHA domain-containing protein [Pyrinomonadaceae bacterium]|nr:FHA domain-containing protein [Pyrinomonadaceae bacterium]
MKIGRLKLDEKEFLLSERITTIGRTSDNLISFSTDSNISRYHAEIENRYGDYWLIDLNSSNGTSINGTAVNSEILLTEGDQISLGGSVDLTFTFEKDSAEPEPQKTETPKAPVEEAAETAEEPDTPETAELPKSSKLPILFGLAGLTVGLAIVTVVGVILFTPQCGFSGSSCNAKALIVSPEPGDTISKSVEVEIETENDDCAESAIFAIDGKEIAKVTDKPFKAKLDPAQFANLSDGFEHSLSVILIDEGGNQISRSNDVALVFETQEIEPVKPDEEPEKETVAGSDKKPADSKTSESSVGVVDTKQMTEGVLKQFSGSAVYKLDPDFLKAVQKMTSEYRSEGFFARASTYKDTINEAFVKDQNLDPAIGYFLAMSRSKFELQSNAAGEGLWRMPNEFVNQNSYNQPCGENKSLSDAKQTCAAIASSLYLKALVISIFEGDVIYSVAAFGKSPQAASIWKSSLPGDKTDFWNVIRTPKEREQVVRFFAAAAVAQHPEKFGLKSDRPISELYGFMKQN